MAQRNIYIATPFCHKWKITWPDFGLRKHASVSKQQTKTYDDLQGGDVWAKPTVGHVNSSSRCPADLAESPKLAAVRSTHCQALRKHPLFSE